MDSRRTPPARFRGSVPLPSRSWSRQTLSSARVRWRRAGTTAWRTSGLYPGGTVKIPLPAGGVYDIQQQITWYWLTGPWGATSRVSVPRLARPRAPGRVTVTGAGVRWSASRGATSTSCSSAACIGTAGSRGALLACGCMPRMLRWLVSRQSAWAGVRFGVVAFGERFLGRSAAMPHGSDASLMDGGRAGSGSGSRRRNDDTTVRFFAARRRRQGWSPRTFLPPNWS